MERCTKDRRNNLPRGEKERYFGLTFDQIFRRSGNPEGSFSLNGFTSTSGKFFRSLFSHLLHRLQLCTQFQSASMSDDAMYHGEFSPSLAEIRAVGSLGIVLFSSILCVAVFGCWKSIRRRGKSIHALFYFSVACFALLDLPRYYAIAINATYTSVQGYACHILSGVCYFIALALVGYSFANLLELGHYASLLYSKRGLIAAVVLHAAIDLTGFIQCLRTPRLADFFTSQYYQVMYPTIVPLTPHFPLVSFLLSVHPLFPPSVLFVHYQSTPVTSYCHSFSTRHFPPKLSLHHVISLLTLPMLFSIVCSPSSLLLMTGIHRVGHCSEPDILGCVDVLWPDGHRAVWQPRKGHL